MTHPLPVGWEGSRIAPNKDLKEMMGAFRETAAVLLEVVMEEMGTGIVALEEEEEEVLAEKEVEKVVEGVKMIM
jgi:hypothetical protein